MSISGNTPIVTSCNVLAVRSLTALLWLVAVTLAFFLGTFVVVDWVFDV